jgi:uncharacterized protein
MLLCTVGRPNIVPMSSSMNNILQFLLPKEKKFFPLFEQSAQNVLLAAKALESAVNTPNMEKRIEHIRNIREIENRNDEITHKLVFELGTTFITPFDREDIQSLTTALDDVVDYIHAGAKRIEIYKIEIMSPAIQKLAEIIVKCAETLNKAIPELRSMKNRASLKEACITLNNLENHADDVFELALAELFEADFKTKDIMKLREILQVLEEATDRAEHASYVIESILIKTA